MLGSAQVAMKIAQKVGSTRWVAVEGRGCQNSVSPEETECRAQFAPSRHHASLVHEAELNWPNDTLGKLCLLIGVFYGDTHPRPDGGAQDGERYDVLGKRPA